jgi:hypothetical protein
MKNKIVEIELPEGKFNAEVDFFDENDRLDLIEIYDLWKKLSQKLNGFKARSVNIPEGLSEVAFCLFMDCVRISKVNFGSNVSSSFDAYSLNTKKRIQIKACSKIPDLTSFGPKSVWDEIYFMDFYKDGLWDYKFDVYLIPNNLIYNNQQNRDTGFSDFQQTGKRPRFSIYTKIILANNLKPTGSFSLK